MVLQNKTSAFLPSLGLATWLIVGGNPVFGQTVSANEMPSEQEEVSQTGSTVPIVCIPEIQGAGHTSPWVNQKVQTTGIVTVCAKNGFYLQDTGDGNPATSDAVFVFTSSAPTVQSGDSVQVVGKVMEYVQGGSSTNRLSITEITSPVITKLSGGNPLPEPVLIGAGGRIPPTEIIDDDGLTRFDPDTDGIDFYESLEGMLVQVENAVAVSPKNSYGEIYIVPGGIPATGRNTRGGITMGPSDMNPESLQIDGALLPSNSMPIVTVGDSLGHIQGVMSYSFGAFELLPTTVPVVTPANLEREVTTLVGDRTHLSVADFNLENLNPEDSTRISALADIVVHRLQSPDILSLQEIQDSDGPTNDGVTDAEATFRALTQAIETAGGPHYDHRDIAPINNQDGGAPGGNIRVGFLFRADRVTFVDRGTPSATEGTQVVSDDSGTHVSLSPGRIDPLNAAFTDSRKPLVGEFIFAQHHRVFVINNHFTSKGGSSPAFGSLQPPVDGGSAQRQEQGQVVNGFVRQLLAADAAAKIVVTGDLNDFYFSAPLRNLCGGDDPVLTNLHDTLPAPERYTYVFEGNSQTLDHILVSNRLIPNARYDIVHANAEFPDQASDHDPSVALLNLPAGDLNGDGRVDYRDLPILVRAILHHSKDLITYDFDHNGRVDAFDLAGLVRLFTPWRFE
jgi:predicted extracellular nuclease